MQLALPSATIAFHGSRALVFITLMVDFQKSPPPHKYFTTGSCTGRRIPLGHLLLLLAPSSSSSSSHQI